MLKRYQALTLVDGLKLKGFIDSSCLKEIDKDIKTYLDEDGDLRVIKPESRLQSNH